MNSTFIISLLLAPYLVLAIVKLWPKKKYGPVLIHSIEYIEVEAPKPSGIVEQNIVPKVIEETKIQQIIVEEKPLQVVEEVVQSTTLDFPEDIESFQGNNRLKTYYDIIDFVKDLPSSAPPYTEFSNLEKIDIYKEMNLSKIMHAKDVLYLFGKYKMGWSDRKKILMAILKTKILNDKEKKRE
jgi:hypothetical protein